MCLICIQYEMGKLTRREASRALLEFVGTEEVDMEHAQEVYDKLANGKEQE